MKESETERLQYESESILSRLVVGAGLKTSLAKNKYHRIDYKVYVTYALVLCLLLTAVCLTPSLLPAWLGYEWATAST